MASESEQEKRETLDAALRFIGNLEIEPYSPLDEEASELRQRIMDALSAPARNCDKFADAESARQAWLADAENWDEFGSPELELHEWLFAPAAERKGENDGR